MTKPFNLANSELGKSSPYINQYSPGLLFAIPREIKRSELNTDIKFHGIDIWNAYEVSWLNLKGKPEVKIAQIQYDANSSHIVESKSLKLYLNSFNQHHFINAEEVQRIIINDLANIVNSPITCKLFDVDDAYYTPQKMRGICIDDLDIEHDFTQQYNIKCLNNNADETLYTHLLRSNCLVTGQPDFCSLQIIYHGKQIDHASLLQYIISLRNHMEFHEQCIERIFVEITASCAPKSLLLIGRYTRRGGIDINPIRSSFALDIFDNTRAFRQ